MTLENLVNYAKAYAEHGYSVIPIIPNTKKPLLAFKNKPPLTVNEIEEIWKKNPLANIALRTDNFFVIDVDRHGDVDGTKAIEKLNHPEWFEGTLTEKTAHNGYHFFFKKPKDIVESQSSGLLKGVDLKINNNNFIVVAPSKIDGKRYEWLNHEPIKSAPQGLVDLINEKANSKKTQEPFFNASYSTNGKSKTALLFETIANGLGDKGTRNSNLTSFFGGLLYRNVDPDAVFELGKMANKNTPDELSESEVARTCESMIDKEIRRRKAICDQNY